MTDNGNHHALVQKVWNYAHVLRDQGVSYGDYIEQITYLLFLNNSPEKTSTACRNRTCYLQKSPKTWKRR